MLQTVKDYIHNLPDDTFGQFYQQYIMKAQDKVIDTDIKSAQLTYSSLDDIKNLVSGINVLTEELKKL